MTGWCNAPDYRSTVNPSGRRRAARNTLRRARRGVCRCLVLLAVALRPQSLAAQFPQYTAPGSLVESPRSLKEELEQATSEARWRLGPLRLQPWIGLSDVSYTDNVLSTSENDADSDLTATFGAGLRGYLPIGEDVYFTVHALPRYVWWADLEDRRRLNESFGAGLFGFYNRLQLQVTARLDERQGIATPEFQQLIHSETQEAVVSAELKLRGALHVFGSVTQSDFDLLLDEEPSVGVPDFNALDRQETVSRAGIRLRPEERFSVGFGWEESEVDFDSLFDRSNRGSGPLVQMQYEGPVFGANVELTRRQIEANGDSQFVTFEDTTGSVYISLFPQSRLGASVYGLRQLVYSIDPSSSYFIDERSGVALTLGLRRFSLRLFAEDGSLDFVPLLATEIARVDDVTTIGFNATFTVGMIDLLLSAGESDYDSNLPGADRKISHASLGFNIGLGPRSWP